jgi:hypothetical protein
MLHNFIGGEGKPQFSNFDRAFILLWIFKAMLDTDYSVLLGSHKAVPIEVTYCDVYATNKTGSSSDDWIYYQFLTHSLVITLASNKALSLFYTSYSSSLHTHKDFQSPLLVSQQRTSTQNYKSYTPNITGESSRHRSSLHNSRR